MSKKSRIVKTTQPQNQGNAAKDGYKDFRFWDHLMRSPPRGR